VKVRRLVIMCESCGRRPATHRAKYPGTVPFLVCQGCATRPTGRGLLALLLVALVLVPLALLALVELL
jgi:hypothetical protein